MHSLGGQRRHGQPRLLGHGCAQDGLHAVCLRSLPLLAIQHRVLTPPAPRRSTGKRSKEGALQDGINSVVRYVKNNFLDGPRQDAYDLVTGTWVPRRGEEVGWNVDKRELVVRAVSRPFLRSLRGRACARAMADSALPRFHRLRGRSSLPSLACSSACLRAPSSTVRFRSLASSDLPLLFFRPLLTTSCTHADHLLPVRNLALGSVVLAALSSHTLSTHGIAYVNHPRLVRQALDDVLDYDGKGYESGRHGRPLRPKRAAAKEHKGGEKLVSVEGAAKGRQARKESVLPSMLSSPLVTKQD